MYWKHGNKPISERSAYWGNVENKIQTTHKYEINILRHFFSTQKKINTLLKISVVNVFSYLLELHLSLSFLFSFYFYFHFYNNVCSRVIKIGGRYESFGETGGSVGFHTFLPRMIVR